MPRGVYQRKSADEVQPKAKKPATPKKGKQANELRVQPSLVLAAVEPPPAIVPAAPPQQEEPPSNERIRGSVDNMTGDTLKRYARQIGVSQRDVDGLTEDRLRQNCKAMIYEAMED